MWYFYGCAYSFRYLSSTVQLVVDRTVHFYCRTYSLRYLGGTVQLVVDRTGIYTLVLTVSGT